LSGTALSLRGDGINREKEGRNKLHYLFHPPGRASCAHELLKEGLRETKKGRASFFVEICQIVWRRRTNAPK